MFGFGTTATSRPGPPADPARVVGVDLTATRVQAVAASGGRQRLVPLGAHGADGDPELPTMLRLDRRAPEVGAAAAAVCRKSPHLVCSAFLPLLGQPRQWQSGRAAVTPETALAAVFQAVRPALVAETEAAELAWPAYLSAAQTKSLLALAAQARLPVRGGTVAPLAVVAHRAALLTGDGPAPPGLERADWVVPMPRPHGGPRPVVVVDVDDFALTASVVTVGPGAVTLVASAASPRAGLRLWKERLLDALADRCVRLCRRDPRDSADAEQALYDQLDASLDRVRGGQAVALTVRSAHWYQDLIHQPEEFDGYCAALARLGADGIFELIRGAGLDLPPAAVWLSHGAARLPGLAAAIHRASPESTSVQALPPHAVAEAAAAVAARRLAGELGQGPLDASIPRDAGPAPNPARPAQARESRR